MKGGVVGDVTTGAGAAAAQVAEAGAQVASDDVAEAADDDGVAPSTKKQLALAAVKVAKSAVREAAEEEAGAVRDRVATASAAAAVTAADAAKKAEPYVKMAAKFAAAGGVGTGVVASGLAAAPLVATAATAAAPFLVPAAVGAATLAAGGVLGKMGVNKTIQFGKLAKKATDIKTLIWAIKVLTKEGWQFILPGQQASTTLDVAIAWIKENYKSATANAPDTLPEQPQQPQLAETPTP